MTRLPTRSSDLANQGLQLRASDIDRLRPEVGTAAEATAMAAVLAYNVRLLRDNKITALHHQFCHSCGLSSFSGQDNLTHICGYCGHGPFGPGWCNGPECLANGRQVVSAAAADPPGENTWWVVDLTLPTVESTLFCGTCVWQIPAFMNCYQSQLLNPDPINWGGEQCRGCHKPLVITTVGDQHVITPDGVAPFTVP